MVHICVYFYSIAPTYVQRVEDLQGHDGMFGVEKGDWEKWRSGKETQEREIPKQESKYRTRVR